jgi:hypothetical protein
MTELTRLEVEADARKAEFDRSLAALRGRLSVKGLAEEAVRGIDAFKPGLAATLVRGAREEPVRALSFTAIAALLMREALRPPRRRPSRSKALTRRRNRIKGD